MAPGDISLYLCGDGGRNIKALEGSGERRDALYLVPMQTLTLRPFDFPFGNVSRIREALKLQIQPFLSQQTANADIFPNVFRKIDGRAEGIACVVAAREVQLIEENLPAKSRIWPIPMALASEVGGEGIAVWADSDNTISMVFSKGVPSLYRWHPRSRQSPEAELTWLRRFCSQQELEVDGEIVLDMSAERNCAARLSSAARRTLEDFPRYADFNLSQRVIDSAIMAERLFRFAEKGAIWLALLGVVFCGGALIKYRSDTHLIDNIRSGSLQIYRQVFGSEGTVRDPLSQAKSRLMAVKGQATDQHTLEEILVHVGEVWNELGKMNVVLDTLRYGDGGVDIMGTAPEMSVIQQMQERMDDGVYDAQVGDIQQIPGGGLRFSLVVRWTR